MSYCFCSSSSLSLNSANTVFAKKAAPISRLRIRERQFVRTGTDILCPATNCQRGFPLGEQKMLEQTIDIGHYAKVPLHISRSKVSESAKGLWRELAFMSSPEKPQVWIRQESLAEKMGLSTRSIRRLITELEKAQLI